VEEIKRLDNELGGSLKENRCNGCNKLSMNRLKIKKLFQRLIIIRVNVVDHINPPPVIRVPFSWLVDSKDYYLRMIVFHDAEREHFSSLTIIRDRWYSSQGLIGSLGEEIVLRDLGLVEGNEWDGRLGRSNSAKIFMVIYSQVL
jgi:hypothetical protein